MPEKTRDDRKTHRVEKMIAGRRSTAKVSSPSSKTSRDRRPRRRVDAGSMRHRRRRRHRREARRREGRRREAPRANGRGPRAAASLQKTDDLSAEDRSRSRRNDQEGVEAVAAAGSQRLTPTGGSPGSARARAGRRSGGGAHARRARRQIVPRRGGVHRTRPTETFWLDRAGPEIALLHSAARPSCRVSLFTQPPNADRPAFGHGADQRTAGSLSPRRPGVYYPLSPKNAGRHSSSRRLVFS